MLTFQVFGFQVPDFGFGFRGSGVRFFGFGFGFRGSGFRYGFQGSGFRFRVRVPGFGIEVLDSRDRGGHGGLVPVSIGGRIPSTFDGNDRLVVQSCHLWASNFDFGLHDESGHGPLGGFQTNPSTCPPLSLV